MLAAFVNFLLEHCAVGASLNRVVLEFFCGLLI